MAARASAGGLNGRCLVPSLKDRSRAVSAVQGRYADGGAPRKRPLGVHDDDVGRERPQVARDRAGLPRVSTRPRIGLTRVGRPAIGRRNTVVGSRSRKQLQLATCYRRMGVGNTR